MFKRILAMVVLSALMMVMAQNNSFVGIWRGVVNGAQFELIFLAGGTYTLAMQTPEGVYNRFAGPYRVPAQGMLRLVYKETYPNQFCGPLGCTPLYYPDGESFRFQFKDRNTLLVQSIGCPQCPPISYRRSNR